MHICIYIYIYVHRERERERENRLMSRGTATLAEGSTHALGRRALYKIKVDENVQVKLSKCSSGLNKT